jgi:hypothetical protein
VTQLFAFFFGGNRLKTFVLSEPLGSTRLASVVESLRNQGIAVFTYPLTIQLRQPQAAAGQLTMEITGPPGIYSIFSSVDLTAWNVLGVSTNSTGSINFTDLTAESPTQKFYRALLHGPPANMVFIPPNPLTIGSPRD